jgi:ADP-heptose:LPS heptosyltransferase
MSSLEIYNNFDEIKVIDKLSVFLKFISKDVFLKKYDIVFDLEQCRKISTLISFLSRAPVKVGFGTNSRCSLYTHIVRYSHEDYEAVNFLRQLEYFSKDTEFKNEELSVPVFSNFCENVNVLVENYQGKKIAIYASAMKPENRLSIIRWKKILEEKGKNSTYFFVGSKADTKRHDELISELDTANFRIVRTEGKLSLLESLQLIGKMDLMITEDGGPLHLAVIADIPTISFWGPTVMSKWKPLSEKHKGIQSNIPCCPCTLGKFSEFRGCPYDFKCLK